MNKGELVDALAKKTEMSKKDLDRVISAMTEVIGETLGKGDKLTLVGFGTFEVRERKQREGRNPKTGEKMMIKASRVPTFSAGKLLKEKISVS